MHEQEVRVVEEPVYVVSSTKQPKVIQTYSDCALWIYSRSNPELGDKQFWWSRIPLSVKMKFWRCSFISTCTYWNHLSMAFDPAWAYRPKGWQCRRQADHVEWNRLLGQPQITRMKTVQNVSSTYQQFWSDARHHATKTPKGANWTW